MFCSVYSAVSEQSLAELFLYFSCIHSSIHFRASWDAFVWWCDGWCIALNPTSHSYRAFAFATSDLFGGNYGTAQISYFTTCAHFDGTLWCLSLWLASVDRTEFFLRKHRASRSQFATVAHLSCSVVKIQNHDRSLHFLHVFCQLWS